MQWRGMLAVAVVAGALAWFGGRAFTEDDEKPKAPTPEEMAKWKELATPGAMHKWLAQADGTWDVVGKTPGWGHLHVTRLGLGQYKQLFEHAGFTINDAGTFMFASPFVAIFSPRLARQVNKLEQYLLRKIPIGFMLYITASLKKGE